MRDDKSLRRSTKQVINGSGMSLTDFLLIFLSFSTLLKSAIGYELFLILPDAGSSTETAVAQ